jgi:hypothetical protein
MLKIRVLQTITGYGNKKNSINKIKKEKIMSRETKMRLPDELFIAYVGTINSQCSEQRSADTPNRLHSPYSPYFTRHRGRAEAWRKSAENYIVTEENFHSEEIFFPPL